jgi:hypothetical protein
MSRWSAHTDKNCFAESNGFARISGVREFAGLAGGDQNFIQMLLEDGNLAGFELRDSSSVDIGAHHFVAGFGQASAGHQSNITAANDR